MCSKVTVNRNVLSCWRNVSSDGEALIVGGRSFHALAEVTGKARSPGVVHRVDGTTSIIMLLILKTAVYP